MKPAIHTLVLQSVTMITPGVRHLSFVRQDGQAFPYIPGQFITLHFEMGGQLLRRSYSIASIPGVDQSIDFAASYVQGGAGTELLFDLEPGQTIDATGPFGRLILREETVRRYILVGTGTGITPYRSMLPEIEKRAREQQVKTCIVQGVQSRNDLLYGEDFVRFVARNPEQLSFQACYSRQFPTDPKAYEKAGRVHTIFAELELNPEHDVIYLCGNPTMIDEAFASLQAQGFASAALRREKYISSK